MLQSAFGLLVLVGLSWALSENRAKVGIKGVLAGMAMQTLLALMFLKAPGSEQFFLFLNKVVISLESATRAGTSFVFGYLGGGALPFDEKFPGAAWILAFRALPLMLVISALSAVLYYWRVIPIVVRGCSFLLQKTMGIGGALGIGVAANIFIGMIEAPLLIRPYLSRLSRSELFTLMTTGMATIAGTVLVLYASILKGVIPNSLGQILAASIISAPASIVVARIMVPETSEVTSGDVDLKQEARSTMDAVTRGTSEGVGLVLNVTAMLVVLVALVALVNQVLGVLPMPGDTPLTLQGILGYIMRPVVWCIGIPWNETLTAGSLMGTKTILNEFIAYLDLANLPAGALSERSKLLITYAMCGFANFGSLGIMIGGLSFMAPERRTEVVQLGMKSIVSGTLATLMTGAVIGCLL